MNLWPLGSASYTAAGDPAMPGESQRFLVAAGQTEGWLTLRATYGAYTSDFRVFVSGVIVRMDPPMLFLSTPEFEHPPPEVSFAIEGESDAIFTGGAASDGMIDAGPNVDVEIISLSEDGKVMTARFTPLASARIGWFAAAVEVRQRSGGRQVKSHATALPGETGWPSQQWANLTPLMALSTPQPLNPQVPPELRVGDAAEIACVWTGEAGGIPNRIQVTVSHPQRTAGTPDGRRSQGGRVMVRHPGEMPPYTWEMPSSGASTLRDLRLLDTVAETPPPGKVRYRWRFQRIGVPPGDPTNQWVMGYWVGPVNLDFVALVARDLEFKELSPHASANMKVVEKRWYAQARKAKPLAEADVSGSSALITTHQVNLWGQPDFNTVAGSAVWTGVARTESNWVKWAQTGYITWREEESKVVLQRRYTEIVVAKAEGGEIRSVIFREPSGPSGYLPDPGANEYKCLLTPETGKWTFYYRGAAWAQSTQIAMDLWGSNVFGNQTSWTAEIITRWDQMVGTPGNPCHMTECRAYTGALQMPESANFAPRHLHTDDSSQWAIQIAAPDALDIWGVVVP